MTYANLADYNMTSGLHILIIYANDVTFGVFVPLMLFGFWCIIAFGGYFNQKHETGSGDFPAWFAVAGFTTSVVSIILIQIPGLITGYTLAVILIIATMSVLFFFFSRD